MKAEIGIINGGGAGQPKLPTVDELRRWDRSGQVTADEEAIFRLYEAGRTDQEIAETLGIDARTVKKRVARIRKKLDKVPWSNTVV